MNLTLPILLFIIFYDHSQFLHIYVATFSSLVLTICVLLPLYRSRLFRSNDSYPGTLYFSHTLSSTPQLALYEERAIAIYCEKQDFPIPKVHEMCKFQHFIHGGKNEDDII